MNKKVFDISVLEAYTNKKITIFIEINLKRRNDNKLNYKNLKLIKDYYTFTSTVTDKDNFFGRLKSFYNDFIFLNIEDKLLYEKIMRIEELYHLNDLTAGTKKQLDFLSNISMYDYANNYREVCRVLEDNNILFDRGYKFGSSWLLKKIENRTLLEIKKLLSMQ